MTVDRSTIEAYVDGALTPAEAAEVERHLAGSPEDRAAVAGLERLRQMLAAAYDAPLREPVPERMRAAIAARRPEAAPRRWAAPAGMALAASVGLAVGVGIGWQRDPGVQELTAGPVPVASRLHGILETQESGELLALPGVAAAMVMATFRDGDGRPCREIEQMTGTSVTRTVACRDAAGWTVEIAVAEPVPPAPEAREAFVPASGAGDAAFSVALDLLGAQPILGPDEEARLIAEGWPAP